MKLLVMIPLLSRTKKINAHECVSETCAGLHELLICISLDAEICCDRKEMML
jgi:hypothetical protein